jgi:hypothetical protein
MQQLMPIFLLLQSEHWEDCGIRPAQVNTKTSSQPIKLCAVACTCHPSYMGSINRRITMQTGLGTKMRPFKKK